MKASLLPFLCIAIVLVLTGLEGAESGGMRAKLLEELKREFTFKPEPREQESINNPVDPGDDVLVLPDFRVTERGRDADKAVYEQRERLEREKFSWKHGGTLLKLNKVPLKPELKWKYNPEHNGIDILSFSW